jgi:hypothetical protein
MVAKGLGQQCSVQSPKDLESPLVVAVIQIMPVHVQVVVLGHMVGGDLLQDLDNVRVMTWYMSVPPRPQRLIRLLSKKLFIRHLYTPSSKTGC